MSDFGSLRLPTGGGARARPVPDSVGTAMGQVGHGEHTERVPCLQSAGERCPRLNDAGAVDTRVKLHKQRHRGICVAISTANDRAGSAFVIQPERSIVNDG